jgi:hypothetical protein
LKKVRILVCVILFLFAKSQVINAQPKKPFKIFTEDSIAKKEGVFILPLLYYTPDTRFAAGMMGVYYFRTGNPETELGKDTRLSYIKLLADYTQNLQLDIWSSWNIFTDEEKFLFKGELRYRNFPDRYYGIGNNTPKEYERYSFDLVSTKLLGMRQIIPKMFAGIDYQFVYQYRFKYLDEGQLSRGEVPGYKGGRSSAFGLVYSYDNRDNVVNAWNGFLFEVSSYFNYQAFGSQFNYNTLNIIFNKYFQLKNNHVLAFNTVANFNTKGVPFIEMAKAGNDDLLRGYARNRYRELNFLGTQAEYRFPVYGRFGGVAFVGAGDVFGSTNDLSWELLKYTYGGGIRFAINKKERLNVRFDYGWGRREQSFYITLTEAF